MAPFERSTGLGLALFLIVWAGCAPRRSPEAAAAETPAATERPTPLPHLTPPEITPAEAALRNAERLARDGKTKEAVDLFLTYAAQTKNPSHCYNLACALALEGRGEEAYRWLDRSAELGWCDPEWPQKDTDLASVRGDPRFTAFLKAAEANAKTCPKNNEEVQQIVDADQADRRDVDMDLVGTPEWDELWKTIDARDHARRTRLDEIVAADELATGTDQCNAALVYQHGGSLHYYELARKLAFEAVQSGEDSCLWLTAAAWDRWLVTAGYPQRFGTQSHCDPKCEPYPIDPAVTDDERRAWHVPPLTDDKAASE